MLSWVPRWVRWTFPFVIVVALAAFVLAPRLDEAEDAVAAARAISPWLLGAAVLSQVASIAAQVQLTRIVLPGAHRPTFTTMARVEAATMAVSHTVPGGTAAGTALGYRLLTQELGVPGPETAFALALRGVGSAAVLNVILWVALVVSLPTHGLHPIYTVAAVLGVAVIGGLGVAVWLLMRTGGRAERTLVRLLSHLPKLNAEVVTRNLRRVADNVQRLLHDPPLARAATAWSALYWLLSAASLWIFLAAVGHPIRADELLVAFGLANVLAVLPITPRGLGLVEGILIPAMVGFGVPLGPATAAVIAWRLVSFWLPIPVGGLAYVSLKVGRTGPPSADHPPDERRQTARAARRELGRLHRWAREPGPGGGTNSPK
jgi:putative heme transporter